MQIICTGNYEITLIIGSTRESPKFVPLLIFFFISNVVRCVLVLFFIFIFFNTTFLLFSNNIILKKNCLHISLDVLHRFRRQWLQRQWSKCVRQTLRVKIFPFKLPEVFYYIFFFIENEYRMEWTSLSNITDIVELRNSAINGDFRTSRFRSICWRLFLNLIELNSSQWLIDVEHHRTTYKNIVMEHYYDPHTEDSGSDDPLSQDDYVRFFFFKFPFVYKHLFNKFV